MVSSIMPLWAAVALSGQPAATARPPEAVLWARGLRASGDVYVLPEEAEVRKRVDALRRSYRALAAAAGRAREVERGLARGRGEVRELEQERARLHEQLASTGSVPEYNRLVALVNDLGARVAALRGGRDAAEPGQAVGDEVAVLRERCVQAALDLRALVDRARGAYAAIAADTEVRYAFAALNQGGERRRLLGPSAAFQAGVKVLERVEAAVLGEAVDLAERGGVHWVDVTFNGRLTRPLVFDTGASSVVLPASLAAAIGLRPGPNDPAVRARVADGSEVLARRMVIPSVRVGRFTVKDVECLVMPAGKTQVPPLLGQSFHRHFTYTFAADRGKLTLSKLETHAATSPE